MKAPRTREWTLRLPRRGNPRLCHAELAACPGRVPRLARLMALALRLEGLLRSGALVNQAELARLGQVSRARISQIMNLLHLAPDIQEQLLFLPLLHHGREPLHLADLQPLCRTWQWPRQRKRWQALLGRTSSHAESYPERA
jgi:hypothetical protein